MPRRDLQALTPDDLAILSNRGLVKRAQRDLEAAAGPIRLEEQSDGTVEAEWPDKETVRLPTDQPIGDRACSCPAVTVCRHIIGTVLAYQGSVPADANANAVWDPGQIPDAALLGYWKAPVWTAIEKLWSAGIVAEVHRGAKPVARLHSLGLTLRFLVPHDARYVQCDCAEETPCRHVPLAVRVFRELDPGSTTGLISTQESRYTAPVELAAECERLVRSLFEFGVANLPPTDVREWESLPALLRRKGLLWPSEIAAELLTARDQYLQRDARFEAAAVVRLAAELMLRLRAIGAATGSVPQLFLRGSAKDESMDLSFARMVGLGCQVVVKRKSVVLSVPLQDLATGAIAVARREVLNPPEAPARDFAELASGVFAKGGTFAALGEGNLLIQGAKRTANGELTVGRARLSLSQQSFEWEKLRSPVLVEDFEELRAHREASPPALFAPRRLTEGIHVCRVARVGEVTLDSSSRRLMAVLMDSSGKSLLLLQPFYTRASAGFQLLRHVLETEAVLYVAGSVRRTALGLTIEPSAVVFEKSGQRKMLQPWVAEGHWIEMLDWTEAGDEREPLSRFLGEVEEALGEAVLVGIAQADLVIERRWRALIEQGEQLGLDRLLEPARRFEQSLSVRKGALAWDAARSIEAAIELAMTVGFSAAAGQPVS
jgi:hypothetical protein